MWLLNVNSGELEKFEGSRVPPYAILSHRWEDGEITFEDMQDMRSGNLRRLKGYRKLMFSCSQAASEEYSIFKGKVVTEPLSYVWIDTFCIKKSDSAELSEAINSMYKWYKEAAVCYAYLSDVKDRDMQMFEDSVWFTRGWTLQELLAPRDVVFYDYDWNLIGKRSELSDVISRVTNIPATALRLLQFKPKDYSIADKMSWAAKRETGREEDRAYSLLGLFEVNMPMIYGEGMRAFYRLQEEILKVSTDLTIFAWDRDPYEDLGALAATPDSFDHGSKCYRSVNFQNNIFADSVQSGNWIRDDQGTSLSNVGLTASFNLIPWSRMVYLAPVCDIYESIDDYVHRKEPQLTVGMMLDRLQSGHFQRVSDDEQALFEIPKQVKYMETRRVTLCRREMQYFEDEGKVIYNGLPNGPDTNGFELVLIDASCSRLLQARSIETASILEDEGMTNTNASISDQHISAFSRASTKEPSVMSSPHGTIGVAGYMLIAHPDNPPVTLHVGYDFDYNPYCLLTRPSADNNPFGTMNVSNGRPISIGPLGTDADAPSQVWYIENLVRTLRTSVPKASFEQHGIELFNASGDDLEMKVDLPNSVRVSFLNVSSRQPLQVVIKPHHLEDARPTTVQKEQLENRVTWASEAS